MKPQQILPALQMRKVPCAEDKIGDMSRMANDRIHFVHQELGDIVDDAGMAARLPQALLHRLKAMRGILLEEIMTNPEVDSGTSVDSA